jgi:hypothetical protein
MIQAKFIDTKGFHRIINMPFESLTSLPINWWLVVPCPIRKRFIRGGPTPEAWGLSTPKIHFRLLMVANNKTLTSYEEVTR